MPKSPNSFFPDVNVWIALSYERHVHHAVAQQWFDQLDADSKLYFCRFTQIGLLRLLCTEAVMRAGEVLSQANAWHVYDRWREDPRIQFIQEPVGMEADFRKLTQHWLPSPKGWVDAYLATLSVAAGLRFVTFDRGFRTGLDDVLILEA